MRCHEEWRYSYTHSYIGTRETWMVSFTPQPLYAGERAPGTHWTEGRAGPGASVDAVAKITKLHHWPRQELNTCRLDRSPITILSYVMTSFLVTCPNLYHLLVWFLFSILAFHKIFARRVPMFQVRNYLANFDKIWYLCTPKQLSEFDFCSFRSNITTV
jgi:hypothetical protein